MKNVYKYVGLVTLSALFLLSAGAKQWEIESFEATLNYYGLGIVASSVAARLIISFEFIVSLVIWLKPFRRLTLWGMLSATVFFSAGLLWFWVSYPNAQDCGCHGSLVKLAPGQSLLKNMGIMALCASMLFFFPIRAKAKRWARWTVASLSLAALAAPPILSPPDFLLMETKQLHAPVAFHDAEFAHEVASRVGSDKYMLIFASPRCRFCQFMTARVDGLVQTGQIRVPIFFTVLAHSESETNELWQAARTETFPHSNISNEEEFLKLSGLQLPSVFLMQGTSFVAHFHYRDMSERLIFEFQEVER